MRNHQLFMILMFQKLHPEGLGILFADWCKRGVYLTGMGAPPLRYLFESATARGGFQ